MADWAKKAGPRKSKAFDRIEVTNAMFAKCMATGACHQRKISPYQWGVSSRTHDDYFVNPSFASYPVIMMDAEEAQTYCLWAGRRLPSEAEWEKAARGSDGRTYPWGEGIDCSKANFMGCVGDVSDTNSHLAGASPYGLLDMAGNLWEWVADWFAVDTYANMPAENPTGPQSGKYHVLRGGSFNSFTTGLRAANRASGEPEHYFDEQDGFRCAITTSSP